MWDYYKQWFLLAVTRPFRIVDGVTAAVGVVGAAVVHYFPQTRATVSDLIWQIPVGVLFALVVVRFGLAPYWMQESQTDFMRQLARSITNLTAKNKDLENALQRRIDTREIRKTLDSFIATGSKLATEITQPNESLFGSVLDQTQDVMEWVKDVYGYVSNPPLSCASWIVSGLGIEDELSEPLLLFSLSKRESRERMNKHMLANLARLSNSAKERERLRNIIETILKRLSELLQKQPVE